MIVLGINGGFRQGYQDVSACLIENGEIVAAVEEERLNRIKFSAGRLPFLSVKEVLEIASRSFEDIDLIAFHGSTWGDEIQNRLEDYFINHFGSCPEFKRYHHHDCHAASAFCASGFDEALVLTMDNSGDGISLQLMLGKGKKLELIERFARPDSLGLFYQVITQYCGFVKDSDEYKVMGLASYGNSERFDFSWLIDFQDGRLCINKAFIIVPQVGAPSLHKDEMVFTPLFLEKMGQGRRLPKSPLSSFYKDVAASAQAHLEKVVLKIIGHYMNLYQQEKLCLAGGIALNCVMNQQIMNAALVKDLYIQPAAGDAGISLGAAYLGSIEKGVPPQGMASVYLGKAYDANDIESMLKVCGIKYQYISEIEEYTAKALAEGKIVAWHQGRMEYGPRALGNRSILANPTIQGMQDKVNKRVKFRESFRPFCPSVLEEDRSLYFVGKKDAAPHMTITYDVNEYGRKSIPAVTHVDQTARIQTVNRGQNERFYKLLLALKKITGHGVVMNTSLNLSHEPIVCTPRDALSTFFASGMDLLVIDNFLIEK